MGIKMFDDEVQIIESFNSELLIENNKPVKIYLEGFPIPEFVELMKIVKDYGGEVSTCVEAGVMILSHPDCSFETDSPKFHVNWLYDCIRSNKILNPSEYQLAFPNTNIKYEVEVEDHQQIEPIKVRLQQETNGANCHSLREPIIKISKVFPSPKTHASPNIINESSVPENTSEIRRTPKRRKCSQQPVHTSCDPPEEDESSKRKRCLHTTSSLLNNPTVSSPRSELSTPNIEHEVDCNSVKDDMMRKSGVLPFPRARASTDINENTVPEDTSEMQKTQKKKEFPCFTSARMNTSIVPSPGSESPASNMEREGERKDLPPLEPINVTVEEKNTAHCNSVREDVMKISEVFSVLQAHAAIDVNKNTSPEDTSEVRRTSNRRRYSQQPVYTSFDSPEEDQSSKKKYYPYTEDEKKAMIQYLIDNDAIMNAGEQATWRKMHNDGMMRHHTVRSMASYFHQSLRHRVRDFISDEEVLRKFQLRDIELKRRGRKRRRSD